VLVGALDASALGMRHDIHDRTFAFAVRVCTLSDDPWFRDIVRRAIASQLVSAATSVGANLAEASAAQSKPDFNAKVGIAKKEIGEAQWWLRVAESVDLCRRRDWNELRAEAASIGQVISAISRSARHSPHRGSDSDH
jgi:four helix bundle protein